MQYLKHIFYSSIIVTGVCCSCHTPEQKTTDNKGAGVSNTRRDSLMQSTDTTLYSRTSLRSTLVQQLSPELQSGISRMEHTLDDYYMSNLSLKMRFYSSCGDSTGQALPAGNEDNSELTERFFIGGNQAEYIFQKLTAVQKALAQAAQSDTLKDGLSRLCSTPDPESFGKTYFTGTPPVAAITILNSFENKVRDFEIKILRQYVK